jgi:hypothetical protein
MASANGAALMAAGFYPRPRSGKGFLFCQLVENPIPICEQPGARNKYVERQRYTTVAFVHQWRWRESKTNDAGVEGPIV